MSAALLKGPSVESLNSNIQAARVSPSQLGNKDFADLIKQKFSESKAESKPEFKPKSKNETQDDKIKINKNNFDSNRSNCDSIKDNKTSEKKKSIEENEGNKIVEYEFDELSQEQETPLTEYSEMMAVLPNDFVKSPEMIDSLEIIISPLENLSTDRVIPAQIKTNKNLEINNISLNQEEKVNLPLVNEFAQVLATTTANITDFETNLISSSKIKIGDIKDNQVHIKSEEIEDNLLNLSVVEPKLVKEEDILSLSKLTLLKSSEQPMVLNLKPTVSNVETSIENIITSQVVQEKLLDKFSIEKDNISISSDISKLPTIVNNASYINGSLADDSRLGQKILTEIHKSPFSDSSIPGEMINFNKNELAMPLNLRLDQENTASLIDLSENLNQMIENSNNINKTTIINFNEINNKEANFPLSPQNQIALSIKQALNHNKSEIIINLYPQSLGNVEVKIEFSTVNGVQEIDKIKILAEEKNTLKILENAQIELKKSLSQVTEASKKEASLSFDLKQGNSNQNQNNGYFENSEERLRWMERASLGNNTDRDGIASNVYTNNETGHISENSVNIRV